MNGKDAEQVLVVPAAILHQAGLFQGFSTRTDHYLARLLDPRHLTYLPRVKAETDPSFKQIIPYVVLRCGEEIFHYTRGQAGTEARLRALRSIGVGGHVNPEDVTDPGCPYRGAMLREVEEEIYLETSYSDHCLGLINDDSTPVGQVHLGIVHVFELAEPRARRREEALAEAGFAPLAELRRRRGEFETWSQFVLDVL